MKLAHPELRSRLSAEYVLGTMKGGARRRFQAYLQRDAGLQAEVARWEGHLTPLAERLPGVEPPARVWSCIETRIAGSNPPLPARTAPVLWVSLPFWRTLGLGAAGLAAA